MLLALHKVVVGRVFDGEERTRRKVDSEESEKRIVAEELLLK